MFRTTIATIALAAASSVALANPGHLADHGHGHNHWLGYALLALAVAIPAGIAFAKHIRKTARA